MASTSGIGESQGFQVGDGNTQYNFLKSPGESISLKALKDLNRHAIAERLKPKPIDKLTDFFSENKAEDVADIFKAFLKFDEVRAVAVLGNLRMQKSAELLIGADSEIQALPGASEMISDAADGLERTGPSGNLERFKNGYVRAYGNCHVAWSPEFGAKATYGAIGEFWASNRDSLGFPIGHRERVLYGTHEEAGASSPWLQRFEGGTVYFCRYGVVAVNLLIGECYEREGWHGGWMGLPTGKSHRTNDGHQIQRFEYGSIYARENSPAYAVRHFISGVVYENYGSIFPVSKELRDFTSYFGGHGSLQRFEAKLNAESDIDEVTVYLASGRTSVAVYTGILEYYVSLGEMRSWLGFPLECRVESTRGWSQRFEGGVIFSSQDSGTFGVPAGIVDCLSGVIAERIGWPVSECKSIEGGGFIQFFEGGVVTERSGKHEIWVSLDGERRVIDSSEERRSSRRPNTVPTLLESGRITEGCPVIYAARTLAENIKVVPWIEEDPRRGRAIWVNHRSKPLFWEYDGQQYSPTGLVNKIWMSSGWKDGTSALQGPNWWKIPGEGTLWELAQEVQDEAEASYYEAVLGDSCSSDTEHLEPG